MSLYLISLLKFIEVKYPVDVFAIFEDKITLFPEVLSRLVIPENVNDKNKLPL